MIHLGLYDLGTGETIAVSNKLTGAGEGKRQARSSLFIAKAILVGLCETNTFGRERERQKNYTGKTAMLPCTILSYVCIALVSELGACC